MIEDIPAELRELPQWVVWQYESRDGKRTKIPYDAKTGQRASSTVSATWTSFDHAAGVASMSAAGVGFVFTADDPYVGVDFDACINGSRTPHPDVARIVAHLDSYTELSPSGTGLHVIVRGELNGGRNRTSKTSWGGEFEIYDRDRYFCMTGDVLEDKPIRPPDLSPLRAEMFPPAAPTPDPFPTGTLSDDDVLEKARGAKNADKFFRLWAGDTSGHGSASEADLALCSILAFWTQDAGSIDGLFRRSGLMRDKWERADYREATIAKALARGETYSAERPPPPPPDKGDGYEYALSFRTATDLRDNVPPEPEFVLDGYLARGLATLIAGTPKVGKSLFIFALLAAAEKRSRLFGLSVKPVRFLYLTEEPLIPLVQKLTAFDINGVEGEFVVRDENSLVPWERVVQDALQCCEERSYDLLIVDTVSMWAGLTGEKENNSGAVVEAFQPLLVGRSKDLAIAIVHHARKGGGRHGDAVRGSNQFQAAVDIYCEVLHMDDDDDGPRELRVRSRLLEPPPKRVLRYADGVLEATTDVASVREKGTPKGRILELLGDGPLTAPTLAEMLGISSEAVRQHLKRLEKDGKIIRTGAGGPADPYTFRVFGGGLDE